MSERGSECDRTATVTHSDDEAAPGTVLRFADIVVRFGGITALDGVCFDVAPGEVVGVIGPNGSGKTTLFDVASGIRRPNSGSVDLDGRDVTTVAAAERARRGLRRTFQRVQTFGWLSVENNVLAALEWRGGGGSCLADLVAYPTRRSRERARRAQVEEVLDRCGLLPVRRELAGSLPIGVARMVELARAIVDKPKVLLLDEPASGLDATEITRLGEIIQSVRTETDCAVLLVEHNAGFVMEQSDRVVVLHLGTVLAEGVPEEVQSDATVRDAYLGDPATASHSSSSADLSAREQP